MNQRATGEGNHAAVIGGGDLASMGSAASVLQDVAALSEGTGDVLIRPLRAQPGADVVRELRRLFGRAMAAGKGGLTVTLAPGCGPREYDLGTKLCNDRYRALRVPADLPVFDGRPGLEFLLAGGELPMCVKLLPNS